MQGLPNYVPGQILLTAFFNIKFYWNPAMTICLCTIHGRSPATTAEFSSGDKGQYNSKAQIPTWPHVEKVC